MLEVEDTRRENEPWWTSLVRCPLCRHRILCQSQKGQLSCVECDQKFRTDGNVITWICDTIPPASNSTRRGRFARLLFDPLATPLLPFRYLTRFRLEKFYNRTLSDRTLAEKWASHYLSGIELSSDSTVLDFGCGRGRNIGLLTQIGCRVVGQDIAANPWWQRLPRSGFQILSNTMQLPWANAAFSMVLDTMVIHYLSPAQLNEHINEVARVLRPGGVWLLLEANKRAAGAAVFQRDLKNLHEVGFVQQICHGAGLDTIDLTYEGFYAPIFPQMVNFLRKQCSPRPLDLSDFDSSLGARLSPERRGLWLLRLRKRHH